MQKLQNLVPYELDGFEQAATQCVAGFSSMVGLGESTFQGMPQSFQSNISSTSSTW